MHVTFKNVSCLVSLLDREVYFISSDQSFVFRLNWDQMLTQHTSSAIMMAIVWSRGVNENFPHDETLQYLLILFSKVALNTFVLSFWRHSILKSLLGLCSISMYVADVLLVSAVTGAWLFKEHLPTSTSMCFILAHGSAVYALLPLPILVAGRLTTPATHT